MSKRRKGIGARGISAALLGTTLVALSVGFILPSYDAPLYGVPSPNTRDTENVSADLRDTRVRTIAGSVDGPINSLERQGITPPALAPAGLPTIGSALPVIVPVNPNLTLAQRQLPVIAPGEKAPGEDSAILNNPSAIPTISIKKVNLAQGDLLSKPVDAPITSRFGMRFHPILKVTKPHTGTDFGAACGTPIGAARGGTVVFAGLAGGYGGRVVIDHGQIAGYHVQTSYSHMSAIGVKVGQQVDVHDGIGLVGTTGFSTGCHLHFEVMVNGSFTDPEPWLDGRPVIVVPINGKPVVISIPPAAPSKAPSSTTSATPKNTPSNTPSGPTVAPSVVSTGDPTAPPGPTPPSTSASSTPSGTPSQTPTKPTQSVPPTAVSTLVPAPSTPAKPGP